MRLYRNNDISLEQPGSPESTLLYNVNGDSQVFSLGTSPNDNYDITTGIFTTPVGGYYNIIVKNTTSAVTVGCVVRMDISLGSTVVSTSYASEYDSTNSSYMVQDNVVFFLFKGQTLTVTITLTGVGTATSNSTAGDSDNYLIITHLC